MANFIIGKVYAGKLHVGYRVFSDSNNTYKDLVTKNIIQRSRIVPIDNFIINGDTFKDKYGRDNDYPIIDAETKSVSNNNMVIIVKDSSGYRAVNGNGTVITLSNSDFQRYGESSILNYKKYASVSSQNEVRNTANSTINTPTNMPIDKKSKSIRDITGSILSRIGIKIVDYKQLKIKVESTFSDEINVQKYVNQVQKTAPTVQKNQPTVKKETKIKVAVDDRKDSKIPALDTDDGTVEELQMQGYMLKIIHRLDGKVKVSDIDPRDYTGEVVIPDGVTHIGKDTFKYVKVTKFTLPDTLEYLGNGAFRGTKISEITLPKKITAIPHECFEDCINLTTVNFDNIMTIGNYAFRSSNIENVEINKGVMQIGLFAFDHCKNLKSFKHKNTIQKIRKGAFLSCEALTEFDFNGVREVEESAFYGTGLTKVVLGPDVTYIQTSTFASHCIEEFSILEGGYKIADGAVVNMDKKPIRYTLSKDIVNIGPSLFKEQDTVCCYHNSIAENLARNIGCTIEYLDLNPGTTSKMMKKLTVLGTSPEVFLKDVIKKSYDKSDFEYDYDLDEKDLLNIELNQDYLNYLHIESREIPDEYEEKSKFKILLNHYRNSSKINKFPLSPQIREMESTFGIIISDVIYDDGNSRIYELEYFDHKYESKKAKCIIALTGNRLRYICLNNRLTEVYCKTADSKDLKKVIEVLSDGDVIGESCTINGTKFDDIIVEIDIKETKDDGSIVNTKRKYNLYQAIFNNSILIKLDKNYLAMIIPANNKIIKCVTTGKAVWLNENDKSYSDRYCVVKGIEDYSTNTMLGYGGNYPSRDDDLFKELSSLTKEDRQKRVENYSHIGKALISPYIQFRNYRIYNNIKSIYDLDYDTFKILMRFPIIEERRPEWLDSAFGKTIVNASKSKVVLKDGTVVNQYKTMKRVAMKNKLLTGGDRTIYIFEISDIYSYEREIFACNLDLDELFKLAVQMDLEADNKLQRVYQDKAEFDIVDRNDLLYIASAFSLTQEAYTMGKIQDAVKYPIWLAVYKPNGLYYMVYNLTLSGNKAALLIQIGDLDIVVDYIDSATTKASAGFGLLNEAGSHINRLYRYRNDSYQMSRLQTYGCKEYDALLLARDLAIDKVTLTEEYLKTGIYPVIAHMFGVHNYSDDIYNIPEVSALLNNDEDIEIDIEPNREVESDEFDIEIEDDDDIELSEEDLASMGYSLDEDEDEETELDTDMDAARLQQLINGNNQE